MPDTPPRPPSALDSYAPTTAGTDLFLLAVELTGRRQLDRVLRPPLTWRVLGLTRNPARSHYLARGCVPGRDRGRVRARGRSSAGRASRSQCEGQGFDPPRLHQFRQDLSGKVEGKAGSSNQGVTAVELRWPRWRPEADALSEQTEAAPREARTHDRRATPKPSAAPATSGCDARPAAAAARHGEGASNGRKTLA